jgi:hypothetical protein
LRADQLCALSHELQSEVSPAPGRDRADIKTPAIVAHLQDPRPILLAGDHADMPCTGVLPDILQGFLGDPQDDRSLAAGQGLRAVDRASRSSRPAI